MAAEVDSLSIKITSDATNAVKAIDDLAKKLSVLKGELKGIGTSFKGTSTGATQSARSINLFANSASVATKKSFSLASAIGKVYASYWLLFRAFGKLKNAINLSADLTETQNVVDVTFGDMREKVDALAKVSIQELGMSELSVKKYASRFQAMGVTMGITNKQVSEATNLITRLNKNLATTGYNTAADSMADMSVQLTRLVADYSSLFNVDQEDVAKDFEAILTGMTKPLRTYGLDLRQSAIQEFALANGIEKSVKEMSNAEQTILRYEYVMANSARAMGDFQRTSQNWANQIRILNENLKRLGATIGGVFINILKPLVIRLNVVINQIIGMVTKAVNALGKLLGWQIEITDIGIADDMGEIAEDAETLEDGMGGAADDAKKLKQQLQGFDKLNVLTTQKDSGKGGGGGGATGGDVSGGVTGGNFRLIPSAKPYESDIESWFELGKRIGDSLAKALEGIDWDSAYKKAANFGKNLAKFLNGLISPRLFRDVGMTIAKALNTAIEFAFAFGNEFDWTDLGRSIAAGVNGFFENFNFGKFAQTISTFVKGILDTIIRFIDGTDWNLIGRKIGEFLVNLDFMSIGLKVGSAIWKAINAGFQMLVSLFETAPLETALIGLVAAVKLLSPLLSFLFGDLQKFVSGKIIETIVGNFSAFKGVLGEIGTVFGAVVIAIGEFLMTERYLSQAFREVMDYSSGADISFANLAKNIGIATSATIAGTAALTLMFGPIGTVIGLIVGASAAVKGFVEAQEQWRFDNVIASTEGAGHTLDDFVVAMNEATAAATEDINKINTAFDGLKSSRKEITDTINTVEGIVGAISATGVATRGEVDDLVASFADLKNSLADYVSASYDAVIQQMMIDMNYLESQGKLTDQMKKEYQERITQAYKQRDVAVKTAEESVAGMENASKHLSEVGKEYGYESEEYQKAVDDMIDENRNFLKSVGEVGITVDETTGIVKDADDKFRKLAGTLDLSQGSFKDADDVMQAVKQTTDDMREAYDEAVEAVKQDTENYREQLDLMGVSDEERKQLLDEHKIAEQERLAELEASYNSYVYQVTEEAYSLKDAMNGVSNDITQSLEGVTESAQENMDETEGIFRSAIRRISEAFEYAKFEFPHDIKLPHFSIHSYDYNIGGFQLTLPGVDIDWYAKGGFPEDGLFFANHNELVGQFSNGKTAVANNEQIIEGIQTGVYNAMMDVMQNGGTFGGDTVVEIDGREVFRAVKRENQRQINRTGYGLA